MAGGPPLIHCERCAARCKKTQKTAVCSEVSVFKWLKNFCHFNGKGGTLRSSIEFLIKEKLQTSS